MMVCGRPARDLLASNFAGHISSMKKFLFEEINLRGYFITIRNANNSYPDDIKAPFLSLNPDNCFRLYLANWIYCKRFSHKQTINSENYHWQTEVSNSYENPQNSKQTSYSLSL